MFHVNAEQKRAEPSIQYLGRLLRLMREANRDDAPDEIIAMLQIRINETKIAIQGRMAASHD